MMTLSPRSLLLLTLWCGASVASAFVLRPLPLRTLTSTTRLFYISSSSSDHEQFRKAVAKAASSASQPLTRHELDQARASFERLLQRSGDSVPLSTPPDLDLRASVLSPSTTSLSPDPVKEEEEDVLLLTSAGRRLRELEIQLLESLRDSDGGIDQLVHLWTTERSTESAHALLQMQTSERPCSAGLVQEEAALAELCRRHPGWAEPWSRLATLLFYKGIPRWSDALSAAEEAIRIKPWHFEALNVCRLILQQMDQPENPDVIFGDDDTVADLRRRCQRLSRLALPPLPDDARHVWVARAVATAHYQVRCAEDARRTTTMVLPRDDDEESVWQ
jgi:hypothetical protein